jgi:hypothetical protein
VYEVVFDGFYIAPKILFKTFAQKIWILLVSTIMEVGFVIWIHKHFTVLAANGCHTALTFMELKILWVESQSAILWAVLDDHIAFVHVIHCFLIFKETITLHIFAFEFEHG